MKAKEYATRFEGLESLSEKFMDVLIEVATLMFKEVREIIKSRHAKSDSALVAAFKEQERKWFGMAKLVDGLPYGGFRFAVEGLTKDTKTGESELVTDLVRAGWREPFELLPVEFRAVHDLVWQHLRVNVTNLYITDVGVTGAKIRDALGITIVDWMDTEVTAKLVADKYGLDGEAALKVLIVAQRSYLERMGKIREATARLDR